MDNKKEEEIVIKVFEKAKQECASDSKYALSNHIGDKIQLSSKTLERAYDRYINENGKNGSLNDATINLLCEYLGYTNYEDYILFNPKEVVTEFIDVAKNKKRTIYKKNRPVIYIALALVTIALVIGFYKGEIIKTPKLSSKTTCMTWVETQYKKTNCTNGYSKHNTSIIPMDVILMQNFKKIKVTMATQFFTEDGKKPLIWYYKTKDGNIEYFTSPGLHPTNQETLKKITKTIIKKYVPLHTNNPNSFLN